MKPGDKFFVKGRSNKQLYTAKGFRTYDDGTTKVCFTNGTFNWLDNLEKVEYEDKWILNDGTVEVPDDADKLEKDGSVICFRRRVKAFNFGDIIRIKKSLWPENQKFPAEYNNLDYIRGVVIKVVNYQGIKELIFCVEYWPSVIHRHRVKAENSFDDIEKE